MPRFPSFSPCHLPLTPQGFPSPVGTLLNPSDVSSVLQLFNGKPAKLDLAQTPGVGAPLVAALGQGLCPGGGVSVRGCGLGDEGLEVSSLNLGTFCN